MIMKRNVSAFCVFLFALAVCIICFEACNKNKNASSNKAYMAVTNLSPNSPPLDVVFEGNQILTPPGGIPFDSTTGIVGNPYLTAIAGVHELSINKTGTDSS